MRMRGTQRRQAGFTLIEIGVAIGLLAVIMSVALPSINSLTGVQLRSTSNTLVGLVREAYARAVITGKPHRIVFDIDNGAFWLERSEDRFVLPGERLRADSQGRGGLTLQEREESAKKAMEDRVKGLGGGAAPGLDALSMLGLGGGGAGLESMMAGALGGGGTMGTTPLTTGLNADEDLEAALKTKLRRQADFSLVQGELGKPQQLKGDLRFHQVWIEHQNEPFVGGSSELYFFPMGFTERAYITLSDDEHGERTLTVVVDALTARAHIIDEIVKEPWR
jgi:general secretion pathway protein H